jgi:UDP-N-acetylglucosamine 2-epimerase (non-hydrolysing)
MLPVMHCQDLAGIEAIAVYCVKLGNKMEIPDNDAGGLQTVQGPWRGGLVACRLKRRGLHADFAQSPSCDHKDARKIGLLPRVFRPGLLNQLLGMNNKDPLPRTILFIFGTRPEAIKLAPLIRHLKLFADRYSVKICVTAQHRQMLDQVLNAFEIVPDFDLNVMAPDQTLGQSTSRIVAALEPVFLEVAPHLVIVQGDTTTTFCGALAAFYHRVPVAHVEAGLRTGDLDHPFPEELNRVLTSRLATLHFAPTAQAADNLRREGISRGVSITGNTGIDAVLYIRDRLALGETRVAQSHAARSVTVNDLRIVLVTAHRRESFGAGIERICRAILRLAARGDVQVIYPVHPNPNVRKAVERMLGTGLASPAPTRAGGAIIASPASTRDCGDPSGRDSGTKPSTKHGSGPGAHPNITLLEPQDYVSFVDLMRRAYIILTDSGGIQEEAPSLGKPVLVLREKTERPEAVEAGTVKLVGTDEDRIVAEAGVLLDQPDEYERRSRIHNPYGDGHASERIESALQKCG